MRKQILKVCATTTLLLLFVLTMSPLNANVDTKKDGIKSVTTGNCWGDGAECQKSKD